MNRRIFKLEEKLRDSDMRYIFNYMEEFRPTPFAKESAPVIDDYPLTIIADKESVKRKTPDWKITCADNSKEDALLIVTDQRTPGMGLLHMNLTEDEAYDMITRC